VRRDSSDSTSPLAGICVSWQGQLLPYAPQANSALYAKLAKPLVARFYAKLLILGGGDAVQLARTLPSRWLEARTVTANSLPYSTERTGNRHIYIYIRMLFASAANPRAPIEPKLGKGLFGH